MQRIALMSFSFIAGYYAQAQQIVPPDSIGSRADSFYQLSPVEVRAIRAGEKSPFAKTNLSKNEIRKLNQGQDIPFLLNQTPSVVVNSDAGTGVGYTGLRIRGTDATRINITLNGIPFNDAESQGSFFVNLPDFSSSVNSIQIQRGVGTSSNGTGAFGATVSLSSNEVNKETYAEINNSYGSFNTWKNTIKVGTGLIDDHFTFDARLSRIVSDGFIDRSSSNLQSFYTSAAYLAGKSTLRLNIFSGKEKTFQAWNGIPESKLKGDADALLTHYNNNVGSLYFTSADSANLFSSKNRKYNLPLYKNETDNYQQTHYQLFFDHKLNAFWSFNTAVFMTRGLGYYENYKHQEKFSDYGLPNLEINGELVQTTDLVRQKWLDNYFYGQILSAQYQQSKHAFTLGGGWTQYDGKHHGDITWAKYSFDNGFRYYQLKASKSDINVYAKWQYQLSTRLSLFADLQYRHVQHKMYGFEANPDLLINRKFDFVNPKAGLTYNNNGWQLYTSYALANKEPNRDDFEAGLENQPKKETLHDFEAGIEKKGSKFQAGATLYYMLYKDQLVVTGMINDVGAYTRTNVPNSYRAGIELQGAITFNKWINATGNLSLSRNKIKNFTEYLDDYDAFFEWKGQQAIAHHHTDISFAPAIVSGLSVNILPFKNTELSLIGKYVGKQYLDNTQNAYRQLNAFYTQDARILFTIKDKIFKEWTISGQVNNIFNRKYEPNGYTYGYVYDGTPVVENFYFPMAGVNFMIGVGVRL